MKEKVSKMRFLKAKKTIRDLLKFEFSPHGIYQFVAYIRSLKSETTGNNLSAWEINQRLQLAKQFMDYLKTVDYQNSELYDSIIEILKRNKFKNVTKQSKTPYVSLEDVHEVLNRILNSDLKNLDKLRYSVMWLLKCSTGLRSEMFDEITEENIKFNGSCDYLDLIESKISHSGAIYHHYIPIHREIKPLLEVYLNAYRENPRWMRLFDNDRIGRILARLNINTKEEGERINFQFGRYFFEQFTKWDLEQRMDDELRKYIMAHEISGISREFYDRATPQRIYNQYMAFMGSVELIPMDCRPKLLEIVRRLEGDYGKRR
jgi:integrase